jgi:hypothetical protein
MLAKHLCIAYMLMKKYPQRAISDTLKLSTTTITRVSNILKSQGHGNKQVLGLMLADEKVADFFNQLDKIMLPPKGNWSNHYRQLAENERVKLKPF